MLRKRMWILLLIVLLPAMGCGLFYSSKVAKQEPIKIYKVPVEVDQEEIPKPPPPGETAESGHWHGDEWHAEPHEAHAPAEVSEQPQTLAEPTERDAVVSETQSPADFVNPTSKSSNPLFADGVPEHLQCPPEWVGVREDDESVTEELVSIVETILEEVMEKWNPNRPLPEIWDSAIEGQKHLKSEGVSIDVLIQLILDFPEMLVLFEEDSPRVMYMVAVETGEKDPDWNVAVLHDGRVFRMKAHDTYQFRFTELVDVENGRLALKSYVLGPLEPYGIGENVIIHLDHVTDEALQRLSGWDYNINPYTTGAYQLGDNTANPQETDADAPVSPFGFGRYPEVPDDYPRIPSWLRGHNDRDLELMHRLWIKLWNQGDKKVTGGFLDDGLFYPLYPNTVYVKYKEIERPDGSIERRRSIVTSGQLSDEARTLLDEGIMPPGVCVAEHSNVVIDPYAYLQLK